MKKLIDLEIVTIVAALLPFFVAAIFIDNYAGGVMGYKWTALLLITFTLFVAAMIIESTTKFSEGELIAAACPHIGSVALAISFLVSILKYSYLFPGSLAFFILVLVIAVGFILTTIARALSMIDLYLFTSSIDPLKAYISIIVGAAVITTPILIYLL